VWSNDHDQYDLADVAASPNANIPARPVADLVVVRRASRTARLVLVGLGLLAVVLLSSGTAADARPAQDPGTSTTLGSSTSPVSVTTAAPTSADGVTTPAPAAAAGPGSKRVADENRKIWIVVGALVAVALALTLLTIRYWRQTRPWPVPLGNPTGDTPPPPAVRGGRLEHDEDVAPSPAPAAEAWAPTAEGAAEVDAAEVDAGPPTEALPVVVAGAAAGAIDEDVARTSRRAVAGADHAGADDGWEPHSTGQHERVVIPPTERRARPTAAQRAAAFSQRES